MASSPEFYTYAYLRKSDNTPYYIGKGKGRRAFVRHKGVSTPKDISKIIFLKQNITEEEAIKHEIYMIAVFGRKDIKTGILLNRTNGGEGVSGHTKTEKQIEASRKNGRALYEKCIGIHGLTKEERIEHGIKGGNAVYEKGVGIHALTSEEKGEAGKKARDLGVGIHALSKEQLSENGKKGGTKGGKIGGPKGGKIGGPKGGKTSYEKGVGIHALTSEEKREAGIKGGNAVYEKGVGIHALTSEEKGEAGKKGGKSTSSQKWQCTETGYTSTAGGLTCYQNNRGIDVSNRIKIDGTRSWQIIFECGRVIIISKPLKTWTKENGYSYNNIIKVRGGYISNYKGIVKVICF